MIRPIDIRLNAAHPELPLAEAVTFTGSPSTVLVRGVPPNCGRWAITAVSVAATFPDGSTTTRAAVQSANGVWVATLPATATSGRTANGLRILADGIDENGAAVTGYILGVADFAVASLAVTPAPQPGETSWQMLYFDAAPSTLRKGDVAKVDGVLKLYNGTAWEAFAGDIPAPSTATPAMDGTGAAGTSAAFARGDHVHPTDTSRVPTSRKVNGKALTSDVTLDADDVGALPSTTDGSNRYVSADVHFTGGGGDIDLPLGGTGTLTYLPRGESTTQNNLVAWKAGGGLADSGKKPSDFQSALSAQQLANIAAVSDALAFDATHSYAAGDPVVYNGTLYTFTATHTGAWTGSDVSAVDIIARLTGKLDKLDPNGGYAAIEWNQMTGSLVFTTPSGELVHFPVSAFGGAFFATNGQIPYDLGDTIVIDYDYSIQTDNTDPNNPITYAEVTLDNRTANLVLITVAIDELRVMLPAATSGKVRDFGLLIAVDGATAALAAPALVVYGAGIENIELMNPDGAMPELADGTATTVGATLLYFSEVESSVFLVKGEQVQPITQ